eukprot:CAMPEP_0170356690 /NCGR_PEP_ID=MMETSP0117_2-20130122/1308_1 /TAXON_ID=400756 /ORGANISM="Durinskia baltica, Strain CSIRO CS-38" /LENGTH=149 /DNA_ID=CAMNT_0010610807 /DNA_START=456 /DNA_END=902 /DNA_ORIENTATION=+
MFCVCHMSGGCTLGRTAVATGTVSFSPKEPGENRDVPAARVTEVVGHRNDIEELSGVAVRGEGSGAECRSEARVSVERQEAKLLTRFCPLANIHAASAALCAGPESATVPLLPARCQLEMVHAAALACAIAEAVSDEHPPGSERNDIRT